MQHRPPRQAALGAAVVGATAAAAARSSRPPRVRLAGTMPGPPLQSLVKYDTPSLLTTKDKSKKAGKAGKKLPPVEAKAPLTQTEDILNSILPPRCARPASAAPAASPVSCAAQHPGRLQRGLPPAVAAAARAAGRARRSLPRCPRPQ